jgi:hypothetical protein
MIRILSLLKYKRSGHLQVKFPDPDIRLNGG